MFLIGVSEEECVEARPVDVVVAGSLPSHNTPLAHSLFRKSHYGGRLCQTEGVSWVNICLEGEGAGARTEAQSPVSTAPSLGPNCTDRPGVRGRCDTLLNQHRPQCL